MFRQFKEKNKKLLRLKLKSALKIEKTLMTLIFFTVHALHLHSFPFQDNKMFLNWLKLSIF
jgi:hypothetical protein